MTAVLEGLGGWLPPTVVTNEDLSRCMDTTPEWIESRTGIRERRFADGMGTADLAVEAGARALRSAGRSTVDAVVVATTSPDRICPAAAPEVASRLDLGPIPAHDLTSACSGFPYGLATGAGLLATGVADSVLVIGAEVFSTFVNQQDRATAPLFGDGAGAVVLRTGTSDEYGAIGPPHLGSDGARANLLAIPAGGSRQRSVTGLGHDVVAETEWYLGMAGQALYQHAVNRMADLGGSAVHARQSGLAHLVVDGEESAIAMARRVLGYLPSSCWHELPHQRADEPEPMPAIPENQRETYDVRGVIRGVVDSASFLELQPQYARNVVIGFARINGSPVGIVANQPQALAGVLDTRSSEKAARFVRLCDAFGLPLVTLVDTPGFLPGTSQETDGIIRRGAKLLYAFAEATVPRVTVILRKAYGGAYIVMNSKHLGADAVFAWPTAEVGVMGAAGAVDILFRRELAEDPSRRPELLARYHDEAVVAQRAAYELSVDEIITPAATRHAVESVLRSFSGVRAAGYRHDNLPQ